jgi:hypothetical protein
LRKIPLLLLSSENIQEVWILKESDFGAKKPGKSAKSIYTKASQLFFPQRKKREIPRVPI